MDTFWRSALPAWGWRFAPSPNLLVRVSDCLDQWRDRGRQRDALSSLDDRLLADIGLTRADAAFEYDKHFWRE